MSFTTDVRQFENADLQRFLFTAIAPGTHKRRALMLRAVLLKLGQETTGSKKNCGFSDGPKIWGEKSACSGLLPGRIESREITCFLCYAVVCGSVANWRRWLREVPMLLCVNKKRDSVRPSPLSAHQEHLPWRQYHFRELATELNFVFAAVPMEVTAVMQTTTIRASMTAYSTAVGPSSETRNFFTLAVNFDIARTFLMCPHEGNGLHGGAPPKRSTDLQRFVITVRHQALTPGPCTRPRLCHRS